MKKNSLPISTLILIGIFQIITSCNGTFKKINTIIIFLVLIIINSSCIGKKAAEGQIDTNSPNTTTINDTLKFTTGVRAIFQDSKGRYWFGSKDEGVCMYDGITYHYFTNQDGLSNNHILSIQEDKSGIIWISTQSGVSSYDGKIFTDHSSIIEPKPEGKWMKTDHDLWFAAETYESVYRHDGKSLHYLAFPRSKEKNSGSIYAVTDIARGVNNQIWIGTYAGVFGYNGGEIEILNDENVGIAKDLGGMHVRSIFEDSKGRLWIGNNGIGVLLKEGNSIINFSKNQGVLLTIDQFESNTKSKLFSQNTGLQSVFAIAEDSLGNIWFGDRDTGAWKYDGKSLTNYTVDATLSSQMILDIYEDHNKNLLFGMADGGVYQFNGKSFDRVY